MNDIGLEQRKTLNDKGVLSLGYAGGLSVFQSPLRLHAKSHVGRRVLVWRGGPRLSPAAHMGFDPNVQGSLL